MSNLSSRLISFQLVALFLSLSFGYKIDFLSVNLNILIVVYCALTFLSLCVLFAENKFLLHKLSLFSWLYFAGSYVIAIAVFYPKDDHFFLSELVNILIAFELIFMQTILLAEDRSELKIVILRFSRWIYILGLLMVMASYFQYFGGVSLGYAGESYWRSTSLVRDYNQYALVCVLLVIVGYSGVFSAKGRLVIFLRWAAILFVLVNLALTGSRRYCFFMLILIGVVFIKRIIKSAKSGSVLNILGVVALSLVLFACLKYFLSENPHVLSRLFSGASDLSGSFSERTDRYSLAAGIFSDYSLIQKFFGNGFFYIGVYSNEYAGFNYPHNIFLSAALYSGIFGCILTFIAVSYSLYCGYKLTIRECFAANEFFVLQMAVFLDSLISLNSIFSISIIFLVFSFAIIRHDAVIR
jgi:hypothetical protein